MYRRRFFARERIAGKKGMSMIILDYKDARPLYEQIVEKFQTLILKGVLEPNTKLPSVRSLAVELSINPNTIQRAYSELERLGFVYTVKGRGNFVSMDEHLKDYKKKQLKEKMKDLITEARSFGISDKELAEWLEENKYD